MISKLLRSTDILNVQYMIYSISNRVLTKLIYSFLRKNSHTVFCLISHLIFQSAFFDCTELLLNTGALITKNVIACVCQSL